MLKPSIVIFGVLGIVSVILPPGWGGEGGTTVKIFRWVYTAQSLRSLGYSRPYSAALGNPILN